MQKDPSPSIEVHDIYTDLRAKTLLKQIGGLLSRRMQAAVEDGSQEKAAQELHVQASVLLALGEAVLAGCRTDLQENLRQAACDLKQHIEVVVQHEST